MWTDAKTILLNKVRTKEIDLDIIWPDAYNWKRIEEFRGKWDKYWYDILDERITDKNKLNKFFKRLNI